LVITSSEYADRGVGFLLNRALTFLLLLLIQNSSASSVAKMPFFPATIGKTNSSDGN
jgi:hypothetical protein